MKTENQTVKVRQFDGRNGAVKNQFVLTIGNSRLFQSYDSIIVKIEGDSITLDEKYWDYSKTTGKYRNQFLGEKKQDTEKKIREGVYKLANLNIG